MNFRYKQMAYVKRIVCLANSYKAPGGRCVAGKEVIENGFGGWIRPVSDRATAELSVAEYSYENGESPKLLDIIEVPLLKPDPRQHQTENHVIDATRRWANRGKLPWHAMERLRDRPASLWVNSGRTNSGHFDCASRAEGAALHDSLLLIKPDHVNVEVGLNHWTLKRTYRTSFNYSGTHHKLSLTDPVAIDAFSEKEEGVYPLIDVYLSVSLTLPYEQDDRCHKLVAAVIGKPEL
jgi:hypothetical protein